MRDDRIQTIRQDFPALHRLRNQLPPVYLDNACTTLTPSPVIKAMTDYYELFPACAGGRSRHWFSAEVDAAIDGEAGQPVSGARENIRRFINARSKKEIIFTQNTSHALNIIALGFQFRPGDRVLLSDREHNSNLLPWLRLEKLGIVRVEQIETDQEGMLRMDDLEKKLSSQPIRLVSLAMTSNVTGETVPAKKIVSLAHQYGAKVLFDAAQTVPHEQVDVLDLDVDFLAFSLHKMCGPRGVGILYGKEAFLGSHVHEEQESPDVILPSLLGGSTVGDIHHQRYYLADPPFRFEPGVQNYPGQIAAGVAATYIETVGYSFIQDQVHRLNQWLTDALLRHFGDRKWFKILGPPESNRRNGILTFEIRLPNAYGIAEELSDGANIMIRDGAYCAHTFFNKIYGQGWARPRLPSEHLMTYRVSLYFYNTMKDCETFVETFKTILEGRGYLEL